MFDGIRIEVPCDIADAAFEEAKKAAREAMTATGIDPAIAGADITVNTMINTQNPDEGIKDCAHEDVPCEECPNKDFCDERARDIAGMADEPTEESEGGEE